jgi:tellurite methyltransferase
MKTADNSDKWERTYATSDHGSLQAATVLKENTHLLPECGKALDLACGMGANAQLLAEHGLKTWAWDRSNTVIDKINNRCKNLNLSLHAQTRDVVSSPPPPDFFDVIVVSRFLERTLIPQIISALRKDGLIFYQTFSTEKTGNGIPRNVDYLLKRNELISFFQSLQVLYYREDSLNGNIHEGLRGEAMIIAQRCK